jgi:hypothetical protein
MFLNQRAADIDAAVKSDVKNSGTILGGQLKFSGTLPPDTKTSPGVTLSLCINQTGTTRLHHPNSLMEMIRDGKHSSTEHLQQLNSGLIPVVATRA